MSIFKIHVRKYTPISSVFVEAYLICLQFLACCLRKSVSLACKLYLVSNTEGRFIKCLGELIPFSQPMVMIIFVIIHHNNLHF